MKPLSPRHLQVLDLIGRGLSNKEVAFKLGIAQGTLNAHIQQVYLRTGKTRKELQSTPIAVFGRRQKPAFAEVAEKAAAFDWLEKQIVNISVVDASVTTGVCFGHAPGSMYSLLQCVQNVMCAIKGVKESGSITG